jgi:hypothetical protein
MSGKRYNSRANPRLQVRAEKLRGLNAASRINLTEFTTADDQRYLRRSDGIWQDATGKKVGDPLDLIFPADDDDADWNSPPWDHPLEIFPKFNFLSPPQISERQWAIPDWLLMRETVGFGGAGAQGKTLLMSMLATAAPLGTGCLGLPIKQMKAALVLLEDREEDVELRQRNICKALRCQQADLTDKLLIMPRRDCDFNYLAIFDRRTDELHLTTFFHQLLSELKEFGAKFVVIDGRADVFWGTRTMNATPACLSAKSPIALPASSAASLS